MKKIAVLSIALLMFGFTASAAEFLAPAQKGGNIDLPATETHKNLHVAGAVVQINGPTSGDLITAGGIVKVAGNVEADLFAAGGRIDIDASVGKNVHAAGGNLYVNKPVGGDLVIAGGMIEVTKEASVAGDLAAAGGSVIIDSPVKGNVRLVGGDIIINSKIDGTVEVQAQKSLTFGSSAVVNGKITYKGPSEAIVDNGAKVSTIDYTKVAARSYRGPAGFMGFIFISTVLKFLMLLVLALVLAWLMPNKTQAVSKQAINKPWPSLGIGFLVLVLSPVVGVLLCISVVGLYVGLAVFALWFFVILLASALQLFYTGSLVWGWYKKDDAPNRWRDLAVGILGMVVLMIVPVIGWIVLLIMFMITLGALIENRYKELQQSR